MTASENETESQSIPEASANAPEGKAPSRRSKRKSRAAESPAETPQSAEPGELEVPEVPASASEDGGAEIEVDAKDFEDDHASPTAGDEAVAAPGASEGEPGVGAPEVIARELTDREVEIAIEAMLFASSEPLTPARIAQALEIPQRRVKSAAERLREEYAATGRAFDIRDIAGGFKLYTRPEHEGIVARLEKVKPPEKLSASALETLAIVAYRQPITRAELDSIRGVQSGAILKSLTERKLIRAVGRSELPGRPIQYGTSKRFLDHFGLASLEDLPRVEDLKAP